MEILEVDREFGYVRFKFTDLELAPVSNQIDLIKSNPSSYNAYNTGLAGNLEKEYLLTDVKVKKHLAHLFSPIINDYIIHLPFAGKYVVNINDSPLKLHSIWVNFMKKCEFNPLHNHSGALSFVIWTHVPFYIEEEYNHASVKNSNTPSAGNFCFVGFDHSSGVKVRQLPVDITYTNQGLIFCSDTFHTVYPFFTSDEYRISVSGNFFFDN